MRKHAWLAMAMLLCCVACTAKEKGKEKKQEDDSIATDFRRLDANHDGSVTKDEAAANGSPALQADFDKFDANKDGKLSLQEATAFVLAQREAIARHKQEVFDRIDANHDGGISRDEAAAESDTFFKDNFAEIDANKDGKLTIQELDAFSERQTAHAEIPSSDTSADAAANKAKEAAQYPDGKPTRRFREADKDHNGTLSKDELKDFPDFYQNFDKIDANHDGKVTPNEIQHYVNTHRSPAQAQAAPGK